MDRASFFPNPPATCFVLFFFDTAPTWRPPRPRRAPDLCQRPTFRPRPPPLVWIFSPTTRYDPSRVRHFRVQPQSRTSSLSPRAVFFQFFPVSFRDRMVSTFSPPGRFPALGGSTTGLFFLRRLVPPTPCLGQRTLFLKSNFFYGLPILPLLS